MMTKKTLALLLVLTLIAGLVSGCGNSGEPKATAQGLVLTDQLGREVALDGPCEKIVSAYYISTATLLALDAKEQLVGIEMKADTRGLYHKAAPEIIDLPQVGSGKGLNIEAVAALEPDLVILPLRLADAVEQLEALAIPALVIDPETIDRFLQCVTLLGAASGHEDRAELLVDYYTQTMSEVEALTAQVSERPAVYLAGSGDIYTTCTGEMVQSEIITRSGGRNVSEALTDGYWAIISPEQLAAWNPDYILPVSYADYTIDSLYADEKLAGLDAVANGRIYTFPSALEPWDYPTPSSILGTLWLTHLLHPDLYSAHAYQSAAEDFYQTFFGITITAEDIGLSH